MTVTAIYYFRNNTLELGLSTTHLQLFADIFDRIEKCLPFSLIFDIL